MMPGNAVLLELFQRVRKRIVPDVVEKRGIRYDVPLALADVAELTTRLQQPQRMLREMINPECVIEPRMGRARIDEMGQPQLSDVTETLKCRAIHNGYRGIIEGNRIPERVTDEDHDLANTFLRYPALSLHRPMLRRLMDRVGPLGTHAHEIGRQFVRQLLEELVMRGELLLPLAPVYHHQL